VFRAGGGIYYTRTQTNSYTFLNINPPVRQSNYLYHWSAGLRASINLSTRCYPGGFVLHPPSQPERFTRTRWHQSPTARMNQWSGRPGAGKPLGRRRSWSWDISRLTFPTDLDRSFYNNTPAGARTLGPVTTSRRPNFVVWASSAPSTTDEIANYESLKCHLPPAGASHGLQALRKLYLVAYDGV